METDYMNIVTDKSVKPKTKIPVEVALICNISGKMTPLYIKWKSGCIYKIDKIMDIKPKGTNKILYKIVVNNKKTTLYYDNKVWLVDEK
ncbi:MAG: hypothetical protein Q4C99_00045 [Clostridia bacterium]|nr:hypothetical protein [Clostridia bacterium]